MSITKQISTTHEVNSDGVVLMRQQVIIFEDGVEIGRGQPLRVSVQPGEDLSNCSAETAAIAKAVWTKEKVDAHKCRQEQEAKRIQEQQEVAARAATEKDG